MKINSIAIKKSHNFQSVSVILRENFEQKTENYVKCQQNGVHSICFKNKRLNNKKQQSMQSTE